MSASPTSVRLWPVAVGAALLAAAIELPISQYYATVPPTTTVKRMAIASGMTFASVLIAGWFVSKWKNTKVDRLPSRDRYAMLHT